MFRVIISPILRRTRLCLQLVVYSTDDAACWWAGWGGTPPHSGHQQAASSVHYTTSCKHSLVLLRMSEIIVRNMLSSFTLLINLLLLHLVGCLYYRINDARPHKHQTHQCTVGQNAKFWKFKQTVHNLSLCFGGLGASLLQNTEKSRFEI